MSEQDLNISGTIHYSSSQDEIVEVASSIPEMPPRVEVIGPSFNILKMWFLMLYQNCMASGEFPTVRRTRLDFPKYEDQDVWNNHLANVFFSTTEHQIKYILEPFQSEPKFKVFTEELFRLYQDHKMPYRSIFYTNTWEVVRKTFSEIPDCNMKFVYMMYRELSSTALLWEFGATGLTMCPSYFWNALRAFYLHRTPRMKCLTVPVNYAFLPHYLVSSNIGFGYTDTFGVWLKRQSEGRMIVVFAHTRTCRDGKEMEKLVHDEPIHLVLGNGLKRTHQLSVRFHWDYIPAIEKLMVECDCSWISLGLIGAGKSTLLGDFTKIKVVLDMDVVKPALEALEKHYRGEIVPELENIFSENYATALSKFKDQNVIFDRDICDCFIFTKIQYFLGIMTYEKFYEIKDFIEREVLKVKEKRVRVAILHLSPSIAEKRIEYRARFCEVDKQGAVLQTVKKTNELLSVFYSKMVDYSLNIGSIHRGSESVYSFSDNSRELTYLELFQLIESLELTDNLEEVIENRRVQFCLQILRPSDFLTSWTPKRIEILLGEDAKNLCNKEEVSTTLDETTYFQSVLRYGKSAFKIVTALLMMDGQVEIEDGTRMLGICSDEEDDPVDISERRREHRRVVRKVDIHVFEFE